MGKTDRYWYERGWRDWYEGRPKLFSNSRRYGIVAEAGDTGMSRQDEVTAGASYLAGFLGFPTVEAYESDAVPYTK